MSRPSPASTDLAPTEKLNRLRIQRHLKICRICVTNAGGARFAVRASARTARRSHHGSHLASSLSSFSCKFGKTFLAHKARMAAVICENSMKGLETLSQKAEPIQVVAPAKFEPVLLTARQVAHRLNISYSTFRRWRSRRDFPKAFQCGGVQRWRTVDIDAFVEAHLQNLEVAA
jgi:predicted DNA-binding transcriptional regulator AlpA